jgi:hypothetical protein
MFPSCFIVVLAVACLQCKLICQAQPSELHIAFYFPMFPLFDVADEDFLPNKDGKRKLYIFRNARFIVQVF